jgi:hypothetical protein
MITLTCDRSRVVQFDASIMSWLSVSSLSSLPESFTDPVMVYNPARRSIHVIGGRHHFNWDVSTSSIIKYDMTQSWRSGNMRDAVSREQHAAVVLPSCGDIVVIGGMDHFTFLRSCQRYIINRQTWTAMGALTLARSGHCAIVSSNGDIYVLGGLLVDNNVTTTVEVWDATTNVWSTSALFSLPIPLTNFFAILLDGWLVVGGKFVSFSSFLYLRFILPFVCLCNRRSNRLSCCNNK